MSTKQHNRPKVTIGDLPLELHDVIIRNLASHWDLRACALTQRAWRYSAQKALHRDVKISIFDLDAVLPLYTAPPLGDSPTMNLSRFPRSLTLGRFGCGGGFDSDELAEFARQCGDRIESLQMESCNVGDVRDMLAIVVKFPSLKELHIVDCVWKKNEGLEAHSNSDIPPPPATLNTVSLVCMEVESPIARWLVQTPGLKISAAHWTCSPLHQKASADSSAFFRAVGRSLTHLSLRLVKNGVEDFRGFNTIDFSMNTCLSELTVGEGFVPGLLSQVLSTVNSPLLEKLQLCLGEWRSFHHNQSEIASIVKLILQPGKFSGLKTLVLWAPGIPRSSSLRLRLLSDFHEAGIAVEIHGFRESNVDGVDMNLRPLFSDLADVIMMPHVEPEKRPVESGVSPLLLTELMHMARGEFEAVRPPDVSWVL